MSSESTQNSSPGYIETIASSRRKTKENIRVDQLIPSEILETASNLQTLLEKYYEFMNLREFIYTEEQEFTDIVLDNKAVFRISDPKNENDSFFTDEQGADSTLVITGADGIPETIALSNQNIIITNGNDLPGSLADSTSQIGKTFTVTGLSAYNTETAVLKTPVKFWAGPGPSWVMNTIEDALDIDAAEENYLQLIQREIASFIPRSLQVDRRTLYKSLVQYYKIRGSQDSIEIFFRLLFDDEVTIEYPYEQTLVPSSGNWDNSIGQYLDKRGFLSNNDTFLHDSYFYQKFSYLIRTGQNLDVWKNIYNRLVHPAGFIFFGEILITIDILRSVLGDDTKGVSSYKFVGLGDETFQPGGGQFVNVYGRTNRKTLSSMPGIQPGLIGAEDLPVLVEAFAREFLPFIYAEAHQSAQISLGLSGGQITSVEILDAGWGYDTAPTVSVSGIALPSTTITDAVITLAIDANGRLDPDGITIVNPGANYANAAASVSANPNIGGIADIFIGNKDLNTYREPPTVIFSAPTETDEDGVLLPTNVNAEAEFLLVDTSVDSVDMVNYGRGYSSNPTVEFSLPESTYTDSPFFTEDYENASVSTTNYNSWRIVNPSDHTISITTEDADTGTQSLKIQTSVLDTNASGNIGGAVREVTYGPPDFSERFTGNTVRIRGRAKSPLAGGATFFQGAYSTSQHGNSGWFNFPITPGADWIDFEFEYNIASTASTNSDFIGFQGDGADGIVYIDNVEATIKYDRAFGTASIDADGKVEGVDVYIAGSGYKKQPTITFSGGSPDVAAIADVYLVPSEIESVAITNAGSGYIESPRVTLGSAVMNEVRAKDTVMELVLLLNMVDNLGTTNPNNNYYKLTETNVRDTQSQLHKNQPIEMWGNLAIAGDSVINNFNTNTFVSIK